MIRQKEKHIHICETYDFLMMTQEEQEALFRNLHRKYGNCNQYSLMKIKEIKETHPDLSVHKCCSLFKMRYPSLILHIGDKVRLRPNESGINVNIREDLNLGYWPAKHIGLFARAIYDMYLAEKREKKPFPFGEF